MTSAARVPADLEHQLRDLHPTCDVKICCPKHALLRIALARPVPSCDQRATHIVRAWCAGCGHHGSNPLACADHAAVLQKIIDEHRLPDCPCGDRLNVHLEAL